MLENGPLEREAVNTKTFRNITAYMQPKMAENCITETRKYKNSTAETPVVATFEMFHLSHV